jgi:hypothetical protein
MSLADSLNDFRVGIAKTNEFISMAYKQDDSGNDLYDDDQKEFVVTAAYLKMFLHWEAFVEDVFSKYLTGEPSTEGTVVAKHVVPVDKNHAKKILIGTQKYVDWANHEIVRRIAMLYLKDGNPIASNIDSISSELADLKTIRNAAAHISSSTQSQLDALATRILGKQIVKATVAGFAMTLHPADASKTVLQYYQNILDIVAENIAANHI